MRTNILSPNLPKNFVKGVLIDYRAPFSAVSSLKKLDIDIYYTKRCPLLYSAVDGHPDMTLCHTGGNTFICEPSFYNYYKAMLPMLDIVKGDTSVTSTYPYDIAYNTARVGEYAICNMEYTDNKIIEYLGRNNIKIINVKQGYSKCSVCVVDEHSIITSDRGIAKKAMNFLDVLLIDGGGIALPGLDSGFIGGCTGKLSESALAVCGSLERHSDFKAVTDFCAKRGVYIKPLSDGLPVDIGTIIPLY